MLESIRVRVLDQVFRVLLVTGESEGCIIQGRDETQHDRGEFILGHACPANSPVG